MKKWVYLFIAMVMVANLAIVGMGCKGKEAPKPEPKAEKPAEAKPAEAPAPAAPAGTPAPAPAAPEATKK